MAAALKDQGNAAFTKGDYAGALKFYTQAITADSNSAVLFNNRAACYLALGQYDAAKRDATKSYVIAPTSKACLRIARAAWHLGETQTATDNFKKAIDMDPTNVAIKAELALCESGERPAGSAAASDGSGGGGGATGGAFLKNFYCDLAVMLCAVLHLITLLFAPAISQWLWVLANVFMALRQVLGMIESNQVPKLNTKFFSELTSGFHGQYLLLCALLAFLSGPPMHLLLFAMCQYCFLDLVKNHGARLEQLIASVPIAAAANFVRTKMQETKDDTRGLVLNASLCEVMSVIFAPFSGVGVVAIVALTQFLKWRYQTDRVFSGACAQMHGGLTQLTHHQYCPGVVRKAYEYLAWGVHKIAAPQ